MQETIIPDIRVVLKPAPQSDGSLVMRVARVPASSIIAIVEYFHLPPGSTPVTVEGEDPGPFAFSQLVTANPSLELRVPARADEIWASLDRVANRKRLWIPGGPV